MTAAERRPYVVRPDRLYTRDDLMQGWYPGADHSVTLDGRIYDYVKAHGGRAPDVDEGLAQRTHDHFIDVALADFLMRTGRPVVGIMGGSSTLAADPNYRRVVHLTAALTQRGYLVVGGGGLGIMEAANLGAYLADRSDAERDQRRGRARGRAAVARGPGRLHGRRGRHPGALRPGRREPGDPHVGDCGRADQPVRLTHREVLLEQHPRGRHAGRGHGRHRVRARRRRHDAGDLPGRRPERLPRVRPQPDGVPRHAGTTARRPASTRRWSARRRGWGSPTC